MHSIISRTFAAGILIFSSFSLNASERGDFLEDIYEVCIEYKCSVTSWIRTPKRNREVGGVQYSGHLRGLAVDIVPDGNDWNDVIIALQRRNLFIIVEDDHLHVQIKRK